MLYINRYNKAGKGTKRVPIKDHICYMFPYISTPYKVLKRTV